MIGCRCAALVAGTAWVATEFGQKDVRLNADLIHSQLEWE